MIKFVSDLRQVGGFLRVLKISSTNKTDRHDITEIFLKVALNTINQTFFIKNMLWIRKFTDKFYIIPVYERIIKIIVKNFIFISWTKYLHAFISIKSGSHDIDESDIKHQ